MINQSVCNEERIAPDFLNLVIEEIGCIACGNNVLNKGSINCFIE